MAVLPKEHNYIYFDSLIRSQKAEALLSMIKAAYYSQGTENQKEEIAKRLVNAFNLFRKNPKGSDTGAGSYTGNYDQFQSQYTLGLEMAIWADSNLNLTYLSNKVAVDELTIKDYLSEIFLSYIQPVDGKIIHPLLSIFEYMRNNNVRHVVKDEFSNIFGVKCEGENANALYNFLISLKFFVYRKNTLFLKETCELDSLIEKCNKSALLNKYDDIVKNLSDSYQYELYLLEPRFKNEIVCLNNIENDEIYKTFQKWMTSKLNEKSKNDSNFNGYGINLFKVLSVLEEKNKIYKNSMKKENIEYYDFVFERYMNDEDAVKIDAAQHFPARAAFPYYKSFIRQVKEYGYLAIKRAVDDNLYLDQIESVSDLPTNSKYWFYQANPTLFDHALCFNENGFIDWHQNGRKHEVGDIVFVYISETEKKIRYRARVVKTNMTFEEKIDDSKYWTNYSEDRESKYVRIELIDECDSELLSLDNLIKHGYKVGPIQPFCLNEKYSGLVNYINSVFDGDFDKQPVYDYSSKLAEGKNLVIYGTPGCGKSYYVEHKELKDYPKEGKDFSTVIRTTFYQDYTNTDFIGQLLPKVNANKDVTYEFNPGPFTIALKTAIQNPDKPVALVIEELNRGNAASIFGDIFQLLDRDSNGVSQYKIHNVNIQDYLNKEVEGKGVFDYIKIPGNLSIIATMNTSDQNVFTLDTAFKRRWEFEKLPNKFNKGHEHAKYMVPGMPGCNWYALTNAINDYIVEKQNSLISEDKQIGIFFVKDTMLINPKTEIDDGSKTKKFAYKMIEYLWNDVAKHNNRSEWFNGAKTLDEALEQYENPKKQAFNDELMKKINEYMDKYKNEFENDLSTKEEDNNVQ